MGTLCLLLVCALLAPGCDEVSSAPKATVGLARAIRGGMFVGTDSDAQPVVDPRRVPADTQVSTDGAGPGVLHLDNGAFLLMDANSALDAKLTEVTLRQGRLWVDSQNAEATTVTTSHGAVTGEDATFAVELAADRTTLYCGAGELTYRSENGDGRLRQGESLVLPAQGEPTVEPTALWADWTGGLADPTAQLQHSTVGLLAGRQQGESGVARTALPVRSHEVSVSLEGDLAMTEVTQTFFNARSDQLEAEYLLDLPADAVVHSFAVDLGQGFQNGNVNAWQTQGQRPAWAPGHTPAHALSYDGPGRLRARLFPVAPGATVRVKLTYSEWLRRRNDTRTYVYPMATTGEPPLLGEFTLQVDTSQANTTAVRAGLGAVMETRRVVLRRSDYRPRADFYLELVDDTSAESSAGTTVARAYQAGQASGGSGPEQFVLLDLPSPTAQAEAHPLKLVLLVDISGGTEPESLELARTAVDAVLHYLAPTDQVALLLADVRAHQADEATGRLAPVDADRHEAILEALAQSQSGGASNLGRCLAEAASLVAGEPRGTVLYLGDGQPTTGLLDQAALRSNLAQLPQAPRFFALALGQQANESLLTGLFGRSAQPVNDGPQATRTVMNLLARAAQPTWRHLTVDVGSAVERVYPAEPWILPVGQRLQVVGRLKGELPPEVTLRGELDGRTFEQTFPLKSTTLSQGQDLRRRWATNRMATLIATDAGREALVELGLRYGLLSPWTSLVVGPTSGNGWSPIEGFDRDPLSFGARQAGHRPPPAPGVAQGWRRNAPRMTAPGRHQPENTWIPRDTVEARRSRAAGQGLASLARAAALRTLRQQADGPRGCFERRLLVRPELSGELAISLEVDGSGRVQRLSVTSSTLADGPTERCVSNEVRGLRFASTDLSGTVTVTHRFRFSGRGLRLGVRHSCSDASRLSLARRRHLWRERLRRQTGVDGALAVWHQAGADCELFDWRSRRALLDLLVGQFSTMTQRVQLYQALPLGRAEGTYLQQALISRVRTAQDVNVLRLGLGLDVPVDWTYFFQLWEQNSTPAARLALVRRWLEALPRDMDLRLRMLALLEETNGLAEARRLARDLRADPLADAQVRAALGEFWLRQENEEEARRVLSEIVEYAPWDPWARRRLGDLYQAHRWHELAYGEYLTLARLRPDDDTTLLLLARAAAGAGRTDEALRLAQELSESAAPGVYQGAAAAARLWTTLQLNRLQAAADDPTLEQALRQRERRSGALRNPPGLLAALTWAHPDDRPQLRVRYPDAQTSDQWEPMPIRADAFGLQALRLDQRESGDYLFEVRHDGDVGLREVEAELHVLLMPGTADEQIQHQTIRLNRTHPVRRFRLTDEGRLEGTLPEGTLPEA
jgi:tetratricopeptide (TPR) repeat protein